jgi:hypothetical protein
VDRNRLYFAVGDFGPDPDLVTQALGFAPTRVWIRGIPRPGTSGPPVRHELWAYDSPLPEAEPFEAHLEAILRILETNPNGVRQVATQFGAVLQCYSHYETTNPGIAIPPSLVRRVAALGLGFDFDLYVSPREDEQAPASREPAV